MFTCTAAPTPLDGCPPTPAVAATPRPTANDGRRTAGGRPAADLERPRSGRTGRPGGAFTCTAAPAPLDGCPPTPAVAATPRPTANDGRRTAGGRPAADLERPRSGRTGRPGRAFTCRASGRRSRGWWGRPLRLYSSGPPRRAALTGSLPLAGAALRALRGPATRPRLLAGGAHAGSPGFARAGCGVLGVRSADIWCPLFD